MITDLGPVHAHYLVQLLNRITLNLWIRILQERDETSCGQSVSVATKGRLGNFSPALLCAFTMLLYVVCAVYSMITI
jgi:hypothetical protein